MRLRCMTMQRDDRLLLEAWCGYHGHLFGFENLTILDNGSSEPATIEMLRRYERAGSTVLWQYRGAADHADRHTHFDALARRDEAQPAVAVGLDCDEWLALFTADGLSCDPDAIVGHLEELSRDRPSAYQIGGALINVPTSAGYYCATPISRRCLPAGASDRAGGAVQPTSLVVIRFRNRPLVMPDRARDGGKPYVRLDGAEAATTAAQCRSFFAGQLLVEFAGLARLTDAIGMPPSMLARPDQNGPIDAESVRLLMPSRSNRVRPVVEFDAVSYLRLNPDVAAARWPALQHYVYHGFMEGRRWEPPVRPGRPAGPARARESSA